MSEHSTIVSSCATGSKNIKHLKKSKKDHFYLKKRCAFFEETLPINCYNLYPEVNMLFHIYKLHKAINK